MKKQTNIGTATQWHSQVCGWVPLAEHVSAVHPADQAQEAGHVVLVAVHAEHAHALTGKVWGRQAAGWEQDGRKGGRATQRGEGRQLLMPVSVVAAWLVGCAVLMLVMVATTVQTAADFRDGLLSLFGPTAASPLPVRFQRYCQLCGHCKTPATRGHTASLNLKRFPTLHQSKESDHQRVAQHMLLDCLTVPVVQHMTHWRCDSCLLPHEPRTFEAE